MFRLVSSDVDTSLLKLAGASALALFWRYSYVIRDETDFTWP